MPDTHFRQPGEDGAEVFAGSGRQAPDNARGFRPGLSRVGRFPLRAEPAWDDGDVSPAGGARTAIPGLYLCGGAGRIRAPGIPMACLSGKHAGRGDRDRPCFDIDVPPDGYAWWYVDGISDDGERAISIIGFIGSVLFALVPLERAQEPGQSLLLERGDLRARRPLDDDRPGRRRAGPVAGPHPDRAVGHGLGRRPADHRDRRDVDTPCAEDQGPRDRDALGPDERRAAP